MLSKILLALNLCLLFGGLSVNTQFLGKNDAFHFLNKAVDPCVATCEEEPLAYKGFDRKSCARGCRLFAICEWDVDNFTEALNKCRSACDEAYQKNAVTKDACCNGCNNALPLAEQRKKKIEEQVVVMQKQMDSFPSLISINDPFDKQLDSDDKNEGDFSILGLDSLMNELMKHAFQSFDKLNNFMFSPHHIEIVDIKDENGEQIIIIEHVNPEINTPHPNDKKTVLNTGSAGFKTTWKGHLESNLQTNVNKEWDWTNSEWNDALTRDFQNVDDYHSCCCSWSAMKSKWWNCVRQKDCLAELALIVFWVSVSFVMLIACCIPYRPKKKPLSVNGDLAFITDSKGDLPEYMKPYPAHEDAKKSPYYLASVVPAANEKEPLV